MGRKPPENPNHGKPWPPEVAQQSGLPERTMKIGEEETKIIIQTRQYKLITPLFGGGVEPGINDRDNLIRATEIRGQLRFWWRAIRGGQFNGDLVKMKQAEDQIWGAASKASERESDKTKIQEEDKRKSWKEAVQIVVEVVREGYTLEPFEVIESTNKKQKFDAKPNSRMPGYSTFPYYAAFPLKPTQEELDNAKQKTDVPLKKIQIDIVFIMTISFPQEQEEEVQASLWAWETFGGIGARTRRGFGSLLLEKIDGDEIKDETLPPANSQGARAWIRANLLQYIGTVKEKHAINVPHLEVAINARILGPVSGPATAWEQLIERLRKFRQQRFDSRRQRDSSFGKSRWPEANALRRRLHPGMKGNDAPDKFPRAAFGLPIVFHLAHERPVSTITLQSTKDGGERWASRLILKPLPCQGKQFLGLAILLNGSDLPEEDLALMRDGTLWEKISKKQTEIKAGELPGLKETIGNETDILRAFLNYLKKEEK